ncbi:regulator [Carboxylicivirga mesophila]|uniref:Regulator n=1 Tax=Carboxylicivirga mesophila TaxID=1166478 RepID=A0ABS5K5P4_9BACT|nr:LuxR C-terminal-related transcriptional regulator [Carboxylicivirga mesophila]MBS2210298.1 regulator [Carboxylicivirga mesophila]
MRQITIIKHIFLLFFVIISQLVDSQKLGIPDLEYFNRRQYEAGTQNWKINESNSDLMYFANNDGLLEYDGVNWRLHKDMGDIIIRSVSCIDEKIYVGGYNEFGYFQYDSLHHLSYKSLSELPQLKSIGNVWTITQWDNKVVFQSELMLCIYENNELQEIIPAKERFISVFLVNGMLLVQDISQGLLEVRGKNAYPLPGGQIFAGMNVSSVMAIADDKIVIGTMKNGVYLWDLQTIQPWNVEVAPQLQAANIFCGTTYADDYLVFGTIQQGVLIADKQGKLVLQVDKDKGLINNTVLSLFVDKEGSIWCGLDNGIGRINLKSGISFINGYYDLGTGYVMDFYEGSYYFGTNQGLFRISQKDFYNPLKGRSHFIKVPGADGQVWSLYKDKNGILCGHNLGVLSVRNGQAETITPSSVNGVWKFIQIEDNPRLMLAGTYDGFILLEKTQGNWKFVCKVDGFVESSRFAEWDENGKLWVSHGDRGIFQLTFSDDYKSVDKVKEYAFSNFPSNKMGLVSKINGRLIFIGKDAYYRINADGIVGKEDSYDAFFQAGHYPEKLIEDRFGNIWFFMNNNTGVLRRLEDGTYKKIEFPFVPLKQKLVSSFESIFVSNSNNVFFGIEDGFAHYYVLDNTNFRLPFKVHLRSFKGVGDSIGYVLHQSNNKDTRQLVIPEYPFKKNAFTISYAATFFQDKDVEYATDLVGPDAQHTSWSNQTFVQYTKLKEGDYSLTIRARNRYGVEALPLTFKFKIHPPWHRHIYAKIIYLILILITAGFVAYIFNRRIEISRQKEKLKQRQHYKAKEEQLTNEALRAEKEMIRIRNEKLRNEMLFKEKELANSTMNIIQKNEFLASVKERLKRIKTLKDSSEIAHKLDLLIKKINKDLDSESHWEVFELHLEQVHEDFLKRLKSKHPELSSREQKLCAYIRMGMSSKEIAVIMNVSYRAVENNRYRLRQNLGIESGENLSRYINSI